jgi:hypothetical protein
MFHYKHTPTYIPVLHPGNADDAIMLANCIAPCCGRFRIPITPELIQKMMAIPQKHLRRACFLMHCRKWNYCGQAHRALYAKQVRAQKQAIRKKKEESRKLKQHLESLLEMGFPGETSGNTAVLEEVGEEDLQEDEDDVDEEEEEEDQEKSAEKYGDGDNDDDEDNDDPDNERENGNELEDGVELDLAHIGAEDDREKEEDGVPEVDDAAAVAADDDAFNENVSDDDDMGEADEDDDAGEDDDVGDHDDDDDDDDGGDDNDHDDSNPRRRKRKKKSEGTTSSSSSSSSSGVSGKKMTLKTKETLQKRKLSGRWDPKNWKRFGCGRPFPRWSIKEGSPVYTILMNYEGNPSKQNPNQFWLNENNYTLNRMFHLFEIALPIFEPQYSREFLYEALGISEVSPPRSFMVENIGIVPPGIRTRKEGGGVNKTGAKGVNNDETTTVLKELRNRFVQVQEQFNLEGYGGVNMENLPACGRKVIWRVHPKIWMTAEAWAKHEQDEKDAQNEKKKKGASETKKRRRKSDAPQPLEAVCECDDLYDDVCHCVLEKIALARGEKYVKPPPNVRNWVNDQKLAEENEKKVALKKKKKGKTGKAEPDEDQGKKEEA